MESAEQPDFSMDPEAALAYVIQSFPDEIARRINRVRAVVKLEGVRSVFIVLALCTEMLQRMERARDDFSAPFNGLRDDVLELGKVLEEYSRKKTGILDQELNAVQAAIQESRRVADELTRGATDTIKKIIAGSASDLHGALTESATQLRTAKTEVTAAAADVLVARGELHAAAKAVADARTAASQLDPQLRDRIAASVHDSIVNKLNGEMTLAQFWCIIVGGIAIVAIAAGFAGFAIDVLFVRWALH